MKKSPIINDCKYDDGFLYIYNVKAKKKIFVEFRETIKTTTDLTKELGELLQYISTYRPNNVVLLLNQIQNFSELYKNSSLHFFQIAQMLGIKKLAFVTTQRDQIDLDKLVKSLPIQSKIFCNRNMSERWINNQVEDTKNQSFNMIT